jgi:predicted nicotinamide N-methyase
MTSSFDSPEDILSTSLSTLYQYPPITYSSPECNFTYSANLDHPITLNTPNAHPSNWSLHASSIWVAAVFLADHIHELGILSDDNMCVLELGAGVGLPSIVLAKHQPSIKVIVSDYPDEELLTVLKENVLRNEVEKTCMVVPYRWGSDVSTLLSSASPSTSNNAGFDLIIATDTLWSSQTHSDLIYTLASTLRKRDSARIHLVAGLHTGRYAIQAFLDRVPQEGNGLIVESVVEKGVDSERQREWVVDRSHGWEDAERERRRWVVWIVLKWRQVEIQKNY